MVWATLPALIFFFAFAILPLGGVILLSLTDWDGVGPITWAGAANWSKVLTDPLTANSLWVTVQVILLSCLFQVPASLLLGVFTAGFQRYRSVLAVLYFVPTLLSSAAVAVTFTSLLDPSFGLSGALRWSWLQQDWLGSPHLALFVVVFVLSWQQIPFHTLIYQGGVRQIPKSLYEAADLDGASTMQQFFRITLPQLKYTFITSTTLMVVGSLTFFDLIFVLTGGGPGNATSVLPLQMYVEGFRGYNMGTASVLAVLLAALGLGIALLIQRLGGKNRQESQLDGA
ncbi:MAG: sugar ABC transporter permease [Actinomycetota bacterium]|nr:sugar ABC transporter permease [Actinomycetota bacterium]